MGWSGAILTDSGGFQVFSLRERCTIDEDGATFRSHIDGSEQRLTPERAMEIQRLLGHTFKALGIDLASSSWASVGSATIDFDKDRFTDVVAGAIRWPAAPLTPDAQANGDCR